MRECVDDSGEGFTCGSTCACPSMNGPRHFAVNGNICEEVGGTGRRVREGSERGRHGADVSEVQRAHGSRYERMGWVSVCRGGMVSGKDVGQCVRSGQSMCTFEGGSWDAMSMKRVVVSERCGNAQKHAGAADCVSDDNGRPGRNAVAYDCMDIKPKVMKCGAKCKVRRPQCASMCFAGSSRDVSGAEVRRDI